MHKPSSQAVPIRQIHQLPYYGGGWLGGPAAEFFSAPLTTHLELYRRLGPMYRMRLFNRTAVVLSGLEANEFVWTHSDLWSYRQTMAVFGEQIDRSFLHQLDGQAHTRKRRRMAAGFRPTVLLPLLGALHGVLRTLLPAQPDTPIDLRHWCQQVAVALTCQALLGIPMPADLDRDVIALENELLTGDEFGALRGLWFLRPAYRRLRQRVLGRLDQLLDEWEARPPGNDILRVMLAAGPNDAMPPRRKELIGDLFLLLEAGSETTAHLLLWALLYCHHHRDWLAELREELHGWTIETFQRINDLPRLKATISEIERLRPAVPFQRLMPTAPFVYHNTAIPSGTPIFFLPMLPHFLSEIYPDPFRFYPQRFLGTSSYPSAAQAVFGGGNHVCLGKPFVHVLVPIVLAVVLTEYDLSFAAPPSFEMAMHSVITPAEAALSVRFMPRHQ